MKVRKKKYQNEGLRYKSEVARTAKGYSYFGLIFFVLKTAA